jgi:hypothetical protein
VDPYASPRNNVLISRNFGSVKKTRFIVNPNLNIPSSLLHPDPLHISIFPRSVQNLELSVTFGSIDVDVEVLPLSQQPPYRDSPAAARSSLFGAVLDKNKVHLKAVTSTGDITVRIVSSASFFVFLVSSHPVIFPSGRTAHGADFFER